jgi:septum formation protein
MTTLVLASTSATRRALLAAAGLSFTSVSPKVDEDAVKAERLATGAGPAAIAEHLAALKAVRVSQTVAGLVIGADQTLDLDGVLYGKVADIDAARERLLRLGGRSHLLHAAVAVAEGGAVVWRQLITARLTMRAFSDAFLDGYLARNAEAALSSVGCYHLEGEGIQLFEAIEGDYFSILGLPLLGLLDLLRVRGVVTA